MKKSIIISFAFLLAGCSNQVDTKLDVSLKDAYSDSFMIGAAFSTFNFSDRPAAYAAKFDEEGKPKPVKAKIVNCFPFRR